MRAYATFFVISVMSLVLVFLLLTRPFVTRDAPPPDPVFASTVATDAGTDASASAAAQLDAGPTPPVAKPALRPLRVVTLGWELAAPAAALATAGDDWAIGKKTPAFEIAPEPSSSQVRARLALGGDDEQGADVAVLGLADFVLAYDRLRVLDLRAFAVVGYSRRSEELRGPATGLLEPVAETAEVRLLDQGLAAGGGTTTDGGPLFLALFALDVAGVSPQRLRILPATHPDAGRAEFAAARRGAPDTRKVLLTTAEASRLVPIVAVAPKRILDARTSELQAFARAWQVGSERAAHLPVSAQQLRSPAAMPFARGVGEPPAIVDLVERLGRVDPGAAGARLTEGPASLAALTALAFRLFREAGLASSPESVPVDPRFTTPDAAAAAPSSPDAGSHGTTPLLVHRAKSDEAAREAAALLGGIFERATVRVAARAGGAAVVEVLQ